MRNRWSLTPLHCINCAKKEVWEDLSSDDYYTGTNHICVACRISFHPVHFTDAYAKDLADLREHITKGA